MAPDLQPLARLLVLFGVILTAFGVVLLLIPRVPWLGRLPGDILIQRERMSFYFPLASCLLFWVVGRFRQ